MNYLAIVAFANKYYDMHWVLNLPLRSVATPLHGWHVYGLPTPVESPCPLFDPGKRLGTSAGTRAESNRAPVSGTISSIDFEERLSRSTLTVCAQFKNQAPYLPEWLEFHLQGGVESFLLYDDGSTDNLEAAIEPYVQMGVVQLIEWPPTDEYVDNYYKKHEKGPYPAIPRELVRLNISLQQRDGPGGIAALRKKDPVSYIQRQFSSVTDCGYRVTQAAVMVDPDASMDHGKLAADRWLGIFDVDEFMFSGQTCASESEPQPILTALETLKPDHGVMVTGLCFGHSGHEKFTPAPNNLLVTTHTQRGPATLGEGGVKREPGWTWPDWQLGHGCGGRKSFFRLNSIPRGWGTLHGDSTFTHDFPISLVRTRGDSAVDALLPSLNSLIRMNHFRLRSYEDAAQKRKWRPGGQDYMKLGIDADPAADFVAVHMNKMHDSLAGTRLGRSVSAGLAQRFGDAPFLPRLGKRTDSSKSKPRGEG